MKYDLTFTQAQMQSHLEGVYAESGLSATLDALFDWSYRVGYITDAKLHDNQHYQYPDPDTGVTFTTQVNIARSNYTPKPIKGKDIPKLHCPICYDNVGIPGKEDLRVFEFELEPGRQFFMQLTPFPLFDHHFVLIDRAQNPMRMDTQSVQDMVNFIDQAPEYTAYSNSDVEWAGASVLVHHHYQVAKQSHVPIMEAQYIEGMHQTLQRDGCDFSFGLLDYPVATCFVRCKNREVLIRDGGKIIEHWKAQDPGKNTCNLVLRHVGGEYRLHIIFRNPDHRTPERLQPIKSEGVGIIEVAGEGIYPVPSGEDADKLWDQIENHGLDVIKGIIEGNNPVARADFPALFALCQAALQ